MHLFKSRIFKFSSILIIFSLWMCWDLSQAYDNRSIIYKSFVLNSEMKTVASPPATVSIVRSNDQALANPCGVTDEGITYTTIYQMVQRAVNLAGGLSSIIKTGDIVLIKPNIVQQDSSGSGGVTDVRVVKALVYLIDAIDHGNIKIIVGDGSPRPFTTFEKESGGGGTPWVQLFDVPGYQLLQTEVLNAGIDFRLSNLNGNDDTNPWQELEIVSVPGGGQAQPQGGKYFVHQDVTHANVYIAVPVMKIHKDVRYTGAVKDQIGLAASSRYGFNKMTGVQQDQRSYKLLHTSEMSTTWHNWQDKEIVDLAAIAKIKFVVVDAITCLDSTKSPNYSADKWNTHISNRIKMNTVMAGYDPVAVDNVCCRVMELNPDDIRYLTLAERVGLGTNNSDNITVVGATIDQTKRQCRYAQPFSTTNTSSYGQSNRTWLLSGYYPTTGISDPMNHEFIQGEASVAPAAGVGVWSQPVYFTDDQILLNDYYTTLGTQSAVSYAFTYFNAPANQAAELWVGSDEALRIYLNGGIVYDYSATRTFDGNEFFKEIVPITVQQGLNKLLVKSYQSTGKYTFSLNICEVQPNPLYKGNRILGLKFTTNGTGTSVKGKDGSVISTYELKNCYPNPFNPTTNISYTIGKRSYVSMKVFDIAGREIASLVNEQKDAGTFTATWNATRVSSGIYFCRMQAGEFSAVTKMVLMK